MTSVNNLTHLNLNTGEKTGIEVFSPIGWILKNALISEPGA
jgi:hypothetical protein